MKVPVNFSVLMRIVRGIFANKDVNINPNGNISFFQV